MAMINVVVALMLVSYISADSFFFNTGVRLNAGQTNSPDQLEKALNEAGFDLKMNPLEKLAFSGERDEICAIYQQHKLMAKNIALRGMLRIACELKYEALTQNSECLQGMEESLEPQCERACLRKHSISSAEGQCDAVSCTANCVGAQIKECGAENGEDSLNTFYSELMGAQLAWSWGLATAEEVQSTAETGPAACGKMVNLALTALESHEIMPKQSKKALSK
ncbi:unnamed protein product [Bursaphelenchus okinawaensis]|uniref:Secreted protein n=1 Tax=Bursaphelenchus okinawaensis TaxID=465554 RepID=A0A811LEJ8_9BILA|nr:unnamed protein product [Bursaphelenchus okinawaensis]CAG9121587.1 unnamed protein product [Bursaphelenchus okinawaensis]